MMKREDPTETRLLSGTIAPNRSNNVVVHAGKAMSMMIAMPPPTIVPMSLGIRLFMECLPNARAQKRRATEVNCEFAISRRLSAATCSAAVALELH
jgi:hypothetical protein